MYENSTTIKRSCYNFKEFQSEGTVKEALNEACENFAENLFGDYLEESRHEKTIHRYNIFNAKHSSSIEYAPESEQFKYTMNCCSLREFCENYNYLIGAHGTPEGPVVIFTWQDDEGRHRKEIQQNIFDKKYKAYKKEAGCLFGPGEFPFLEFHVIKLNSRYYSFYTIAR